jgi:hypothetical protein
MGAQLKFLSRLTVQQCGEAGLRSLASKQGHGVSQRASQNSPFNFVVLMVGLLVQGHLIDRNLERICGWGGRACALEVALEVDGAVVRRGRVEVVRVHRTPLHPSTSLH